MGDGGKGDRQRPIENKEAFEKNWDAIFGKKEKKDKDLSLAEPSPLPRSSKEERG